MTSTIAEQLRVGASGPGERRTITLLFCDVKDSTATAELLDPEDWSAIMRATLDRFIGPVERYGGTVARILGDAILAYFGAPTAHEDDPQRAVLAGLAIIEGCQDLAADVQRRFGVPFNVRVGINTGLVVVGEVGSTLYGEYAALGDAANVAARMEQTAQPGTVRIAEATHRLVSPLFDVESIGPVEVRGRREAVGAYRVLRPKSVPGSLRGITGLPSPLVGRDQQLTRLRTLLGGLHAGQGHVVSLIGEAGIGKSRLVSELARDAAAGNITWVEGGCFSYENTTPYAPFAKAVKTFFGIGPEEGPQSRYERIAERVTQLLGPAGRRHAAHLATVLGLPVPAADDAYVRFLDPPVLRQRIFDTVATLLEGLAGQKPVVLAVEDVHWADATSVDLLEALLPLTDRLPILLLLCFRPGRSEPSWRIHEAATRGIPHRYTAVELRPLADEDASKLVDQLLRADGLSRNVRRLILRKAEGNPFFVEEVVRALLDAQSVVRDGGGLVVIEDIESIRVPDTLVGVLTTRLDALQPDARRVLQSSAVIGREFGEEMLRAVVVRSVPLDAVLSQLQQREFIVEKSRFPERIFMFKHALTRDAAYDTLLLSVRRDMHRMLGKLIEESHPDRVHDLAHHFLEADEPLRALPYLVAAGDLSLKAFAVVDAAHLYLRALNIWSDGQNTELARRAYEGLGGARMFVGDIPGALDAYRRLEAFAVEHGNPTARTSALNKQAMAHLVGTGDLLEAERVLLAARTEALRADDLEGMAEFHVGYCVFNTITGRLDEAAEHLGEAAEVCFTLDPYHRNFGLTHYATTLMYQTRLDEARAAFQRAWTQAQQDNDRQHLVHLLLLDAELELLAGNGETGLARAVDGLAMAADIGAPLEEGLSAWTVGTLAAHLGRYESAAAHFERTVAISAATGVFAFQAAALTGLALIHQAIHGRGSERVPELLTRARAALDLPMGGFMLGTVHTDMATALLFEGKFDEAAAAARTALERRSATMLLVRPKALLCSGHAALAKGDRETGRTRLAEASTYVAEHRIRQYLPDTLLGEAVIAFHDRDDRHLLDRLEKADCAAAEMHLRAAALDVRTKGAELLRCAGLDAAAEEFLTRAADTVAEIAALIDEPELRAAFLRTHVLRAG